MGIFKSASSVFMSRNAADVQLVSAKLAETEAAVGPIERRLREVSLSCALSGDYGPAEKIGAELHAVREKIAVLRRALEVAEAAELERINAAKERELRARSRAVRQHAAALNRATEAYETSAAAMRTSWDRVTTTAASLRAVLGNTHLENPELGERRLLALAERELARIGHEPGRTGAVPIAPGASAAVLGGDLPHQLRPITETMRGLLDRYLLTFDRKLGLAPPAPPKAPVERTSWTGPSPGTHAWHLQRLEILAAVAPAEPEQLEEKPDILAKVLQHFPAAPMPVRDEPAAPPPPWPDGTREAEGFAFELAAIAAANAAEMPADEPQDAEEAQAATDVPENAERVYASVSPIPNRQH
jgi:hypothetical protein